MLPLLRLILCSLRSWLRLVSSDLFHFHRFAPASSRFIPRLTLPIPWPKDFDFSLSFSLILFYEGECHSRDVSMGLLFLYCYCYLTSPNSLLLYFTTAKATSLTLLYILPASSTYLCLERSLFTQCYHTRGHELLVQSSVG